MRPAEAALAFETVIHHRPADAAAWLALGRALRQVRKPAMARMALMKAVAFAETGSLPKVVEQANEVLAKLPPE